MEVENMAKQTVRPNYKALCSLKEEAVKELNKATNGIYPGLKRHANNPGKKMQFNNADALCKELHIPLDTILELESKTA